MRQIVLLVLASCVCLLGCHTKHKDLVAGPISEQSLKSPTNILYDDLEWLVGEWACVKKELRGKQNNPLGPEKIDRLKVFYPFYDQLTLALTSVPNRQITAEFLVTGRDGSYRAIDAGTDSVMIGTDRILVGNPSPLMVEFTYKYRFDEAEAVSLLEMREMGSGILLIFKKISDTPGKAETLWGVNQESQQKLFRQLRHAYQQLKFERMNASHVGNE